MQSYYDKHLYQYASYIQLNKLGPCIHMVSKKMLGLHATLDLLASNFLSFILIFDPFYVSIPNAEPGRAYAYQNQTLK